MNAGFITYNLFLSEGAAPWGCAMFGGDSRYRELEWVIVKSHKDFMQTIIDRFNQGEFPSLVSFGYDLGWMIPKKIEFDSDGKLHILNADTDEPYDNPPNGLDSVIFLKQWCKENSLEFPECLVHTTHSWGADEIWKEINSAKKQ